MGKFFTKNGALHLGSYKIENPAQFDDLTSNLRKDLCMDYSHRFPESFWEEHRGDSIHNFIGHVTNLGGYCQPPVLILLQRMITLGGFDASKFTLWQHVGIPIGCIGFPHWLLQLDYMGVDNEVTVARLVFRLPIGKDAEAVDSQQVLETPWNNEQLTFNFGCPLSEMLIAFQDACEAYNTYARGLSKKTAKLKSPTLDLRGKRKAPRKRVIKMKPELPVEAPAELPATTGKKVRSRKKVPDVQPPVDGNGMWPPRSTIFE